MKYLSLKGIAVLAVAVIPMLLKFKLHKRNTPVVTTPSILVEAV